MPKKTQREIDAEIAALEKLKPVGPYARKTKGVIDVMTDTLKAGTVDDTCDEWNELTDEQQMAACDAHNWATGDNDKKPSEDFGSLVE